MSLYFTWAGVRVPRLVFMLVSSFVAAVVTITMLTSDAFAVDVPTVKTVDDESANGADSDGDGDPDRPDAVSAAITARMLDKPVEDLSKRSETTRTLVNPDGTLTAEDFGTPVRVQRGDRWLDVDYDLEQQSDGSYAPKVVPQDLEISTSMEELPAPKVEGGVATYKMSESTDPVVSVTAAGVATRIRLNEAPAEDDPVFTLGLRADDLDIDQAANGGLKGRRFWWQADWFNVHPRGMGREGRRWWRPDTCRVARC